MASATTPTLKVKSDCVVLDGKELEMEKWSMPYQDAATRLQRPELKIVSLQKACSFGDELASDVSWGRAVEQPELGTVKGIVRCSAMTRRQVQCRQMVHLPSMGEYCRFHVNTKDHQKAKGGHATSVADSINELLDSSDKDRRAAILNTLAPSSAASAAAAAAASAAAVGPAHGDTSQQAHKQKENIQQQQQKENIPQQHLHAKQQTMSSMLGLLLLPIAVIAILSSADIAGLLTVATPYGAAPATELLQRSILLHQTSRSTPPPVNGNDSLTSSSKVTSTPTGSSARNSSNSSGNKSSNSSSRKNSNGNSSSTSSTTSSNGSCTQSSNSTISPVMCSNSSSSSPADRDKQAAEAFSSSRDMALAIQLSLTKRMRFDSTPHLAQQAKDLHTRLFLHPNAEIALLAFKNYRYLHHIATVTPRGVQKPPQHQQQHRAAAVAGQAAAGAAAAEPKARGASLATDKAGSPVAVPPAEAAAAAEAGSDQRQVPQPPPLDSAADVRRALRELKKPKLVSSTLSALKQTQKAGEALQRSEERQQKRLAKEQQQNLKAAKMQRAAASTPTGSAAAAGPAATEAEKREILEKMLQLKSSVADIVDEASHSHWKTASAIWSCERYTDRLNAACVARNHQQQPRKATKRFVQCGGCGHKPIPTLNNQLPDGCPKCRVASQHLSFRVISLYAPKAAKLLDQEKLSIDGTEVVSSKQQQQQLRQPSEEGAGEEGFFEHPDLPNTS
ncbi:hypothetical protein, conserved [Eimeria maxima]|uniref:Replication factor Mcm10 C-terminal domain-containing protein n=1 Tax=Eimeria maxima TaxID=5804 RepID=U6LVX1_EIMMA|nr:hypothetical protein, conserved [Eimeria maxima]CDJ56082.1 hypothetical protein, conserved [Eimeria maxima]